MKRLCLRAMFILAVLTATRWPLAPKYLYSFDSVNFALALREFDPGLHQPQPPGYPLFVGFTRLLHLLVSTPEHVFLLAGILAGALALMCLWQLGDEMFGAGAGIAAVLLFLFNPVFWYGGLTNQIRIFLAACACGTALFAWRAWQAGSSAKWLYASALVLGIGSGFRPALLLCLSPLLLVLAWRRRESARDLGTAALLLGVTIASWSGVLLYEAGGLAPFWHMLSDYSEAQFAGSSLLFGAPFEKAWRMAQASVVWNGLGVVSWIWAVPFVVRRHAADSLRKPWSFLALWFLPGFLFSTLVHVGDPDHTLATVPVTCLLGGWILANFPRLGAYRNRWRWAVVAVAMGVNVLLFLHPRPGLARISSYRTVRAFDRHIRRAVEAIADMRASGPLVLIYCRSYLSWRHLAYYFPEETLFVVEQSSLSEGKPYVWRLNKDRQEPVPVNDGPISLPPARQILVLLWPSQEVTGRVGQGRVWRQSGPLVRMDADPALSFQLGSLSFVTANSAPGEGHALSASWKVTER